MITAIATVLLGVAVCYALKSVIKPINFPPGPRWYPLFGCTNAVDVLCRRYGCQWKALGQLARDYSSNLLGLKLGSDSLVVVFGSKNIKQVHTQNEFDGRPSNFFIRLRCLGTRFGITFADGPLWREHRLFTLKHLKNVGFGRTAMETEIQNQTLALVKKISQNNLSLEIRPLLGQTVMNVLWKYVAGESIEEERFFKLRDNMDARSKAFGMAGGWLNHFPWLRFIFPKMTGYKLITKINEQISGLIEESIQKHREKKIKVDDFMYSFMNQSENDKANYTDEHLKIICLDLLIAGSQTSSSVVDFALLTAVRNPKLQEKIFNEIKEVVGDRPPSWSDSYKMTYTTAFLSEVLRFYSIAPLTGPRRVTKQTTLDGYTLPKDTTILMAVRELHHDPEIWTDPQEFKPERFIDENGKPIPAENLIPFGMGHRRCPGESLARSFIFLVFVGLLQHYKISSSTDEMPTDEPIYGIISTPKPYKANYKSRT